MIDNLDLLAELDRAATEQRTPAPQLLAALRAVSDPMLARRAGRILQDLQPEDGQLAPIEVAVLATCTIGPFEQLLRSALVSVGLLPKIRLGEYGSFGISLASGDFAAEGDPDLLVCLLDESCLLPGEWDAADVATLISQLQERAAGLGELISTALERTSATVLLHTVGLPARVRNTLIGWRAKAALARAWHQVNADLLGLAERHRQVVAIDLVSELSDQPVATRDARLHSYADLPYTDGALLVLAQQVGRVAQARSGRSRKVLALDLDNTLWGGVLGEVGAHGLTLGGLYPGRCYRELQQAAHRLRQQGVILVLASKNDPEPVAEALRGHPDMLLRADAFSVSAVGWTAKADSLRQAAESLNLSTGSFVFMDDSQFERGQVGSELPEVALVAADGDPAHLVNSLLNPGWFDVLELTDTDRQRPELYRSRALRSDFSGGFGSSTDYLQALDIELSIEPVSDFGVPRVAQLAARTNQFNLTGVRYDEQACAAMCLDPQQLVLALSVRDRFGDEGVVGALWVRCDLPDWQVLNFVLSCRVLSRGIELAAIDWLAERATAAGASGLLGSYLPSAKNGAAADFWQRAGFAQTEREGAFHLDLQSGRNPAPAWITVHERKEALT